MNKWRDTSRMACQRNVGLLAIGEASTEACLARGSDSKASLWGHVRSAWSCHLQAIVMSIDYISCLQQRDNSCITTELQSILNGVRQRPLNLLHSYFLHNISRHKENYNLKQNNEINWLLYIYSILWASIILSMYTYSMCGCNFYVTQDCNIDVTILSTIVI